MYLGKIVELTSTARSCIASRSILTRRLCSPLFPIPDPTLKRERIILQGDVPLAVNPPSGCRFHTRCPFAVDICKSIEPPLEELRPGHFVACHVAKDQLAGQKQMATA
jgi:oligopeptide/dipeptide ABC transporter ATP-binding protein